MVPEQVVQTKAGTDRISVITLDVDFTNQSIFFMQPPELQTRQQVMSSATYTLSWRCLHSDKN